MRQAIVTKFLGPTNTRGSRVKATCEGGALTEPWDHSLSTAENHRKAAMKLAMKLDWGGWWIGGFATKMGHVWVMYKSKVRHKASNCCAEHCVGGGFFVEPAEN